MDEDRRVVVAQRSDETVNVVRGHCRTMAYVLAHDPDPSGLLLEIVGETLTVEACGECGVQMKYVNYWMTCPSCGEQTNRQNAGEVEITVVSPVALAAPSTFRAVMEMYPDLEIPVLIVDYDAAGEHMALLGDNYNMQQPDVLGEARGFAAAIAAGASPDDVALNTGKSRRYVDARLALAEMPQAIQQAVAEGQIGLSALHDLAHLREVGGDVALTAFVDTVTGGHRYKPTRIMRWVAEAGELAWSPMPMAGLRDRNHWRVWQVLWKKVMEQDPAAAWACVMVGDYGVDDLMEAAGWSDEDVALAVTEVNCANCLVRDVLGHIPPVGWHPGYPCQKTADTHWCMHAVGPGENYQVRVSPPRFRDTADVVFEESAWEAWFENEAALLAAMQEVYDAPYLEEVKTAGVLAAAGISTGSDEDGDDAKEAGPAEKARALIRTYMDWHLQASGEDHPLATRCVNCRYRRSDSPVMSRPDAPHCDWAKGGRTLAFHAYLTGTVEDPYVIPVCRQYASVNAWPVIIPDSPHYIVTPETRGWWKEFIRRLAAHYTQQMRWEHGPLLEQLTGVPPKKSTKHESWFLDQYAATFDELGDQQVATLVQWVVGFWTWQRNNSEAPLPMKEGVLSQFTRALIRLPEQMSDEALATIYLRVP